MDGIETYWIWLIIGLALASLELVVPGVYLIWMAMAALAVAVLAFVSVPPLALQIIAWVSLSLIFVFSARRWLRERPIVSSDPLLNNRGGRMVGLFHDAPGRCQILHPGPRHEFQVGG